MPRAVGILGGTFDPIHYGHLLAGQEAYARFHLEQVIFVPNGCSPFKVEQLVAPPESRYEMAVLATAGNPAFTVSRIELDRPGPSYTVDTLEQFRREYSAETKLYLITGLDAMLEFPAWHNPDRIAALVEFIVVPRPGFNETQLHANLAASILSRIHLLAMPELDIASTELRRRAAAGESLRYLTPPPVIRYLKKNGLYRGVTGGNSSR